MSILVQIYLDILKERTYLPFIIEYTNNGRGKPCRYVLISGENDTSIKFYLEY
jgi:hypothetical protein